MKKLSIRQEILQNTRKLKGFGRSKYEDKLTDKQYLKHCKDNEIEVDKLSLLHKNFFYSQSTYDQYIQKAVIYTKWLSNDLGHRPSFSEQREHIEDYLDFRVNLAKNGDLSAGTVMAERTQLSKIYQVDLDHYNCPKRTGATKGRSHDRHWNNDNHREQMRFYEMTGFRKAEYTFLSEQRIAGYEKKTQQRLERDLHGRVCNLQPNYENGLITSITALRCKHGKTNTAVVLPEHREAVTEIFSSRKFEEYLDPSDHCNVHACRRQYAQELYKKVTRDLSTLPESDLYRCRGENAGKVYDKQALDIVSNSLGHGNGRYYDVVHHYFH